MTASPCPRSPMVLAATRTGRHRDPELERHLLGCAACHDALVVESALRRAAATFSPALPTPAALRFRAERRSAELARARALAPLRLWQATAAVALAGTLALLFQDLAPVARFLAAGISSQGASGGSGAGLALLALLSLAALAGLWLSAVEGSE